MYVLAGGRLCCHLDLYRSCCLSGSIDSLYLFLQLVYCCMFNVRVISFLSKSLLQNLERLSQYRIVWFVVYYKFMLETEKIIINILQNHVSNKWYYVTWEITGLDFVMWICDWLVGQANIVCYSKHHENKTQTFTLNIFKSWSLCCNMEC